MTTAQDPIVALLTPSVLAEIEAVLTAAYPHEGCGIIVETPAGEPKVLVSTNLTEHMRDVDPDYYTRGAEEGYVLDTRLIVQAERRDEVLRVIFHSHPDVGAYFSEEDHRKAVVDWGDGPEPAYPDVDYLVTAVNKGVVAEHVLFRYESGAGGFVDVARQAPARDNT